MISYKLIRCRRRSIGIIIKGNEVIVRSPIKTPLREIDKFVLYKEKWINKHLSSRHFLDNVVKYNSALVYGKEVPLKLCDENAIKENEVCVRSLSAVCKLYLKTFKDEFLQIFDEFAKRYNFSYNSVKFRSYKSRWGCCDKSKNIVFNIKLLMLSRELWICVIVHELCHTVFMNHSKDFHVLFESVLENHKKFEKDLQRYSPVCGCY